MDTPFTQTVFAGKSRQAVKKFMSQHSAKKSLNLGFTRPGKTRDEMVINNISLDSRQITENDLFLAVQGEIRHGLDFLDRVLKKLPGLVICDRALTKQEQLLLEHSNVNCEVWVIADIKDFIGFFADWFYDHPSQQLKVVGITGTNGKTSTAFFTGQLLKQLNQSVALMGTLGNGAIEALQPSNNTTPESVTVHRLLSEYKCQGIEWVVMEVSSHGLCLGRIQGVHFETAALTQVTRDHLDFHGTEAAYREAKAKLFTDYPAQSQVLNRDDSLGEILWQKNHLNPDINVWGYQASVDANANAYNQPVNLACMKCDLTAVGITFDVRLNQKERFESLNVPLMGSFNLENVFCAISILLVNQFDVHKVFGQLAFLESVAGRMQILARTPTVLLDFAHTPDALQHILIAVKAHLSDSTGQLKVVFGCGGNRDKGKRPLMGAVAEKFADTVVLTTDNPRDEEPEHIISDIEQGLLYPNKVSTELNRETAILKALKAAKPDDILVIAGKGHEDYQEVKGKKIPYSDIEVVSRWLKQNTKKSDVIDGF